MQQGSPRGPQQLFSSLCPPTGGDEQYLSASSHIANVIGKQI
tara:strand:- start:737 stop:862 length:126 start_codon:yes stop_codon:yes gene_type:complete